MWSLESKTGVDGIADIEPLWISQQRCHRIKVAFMNFEMDNNKF